MSEMTTDSTYEVKFARLETIVKQLDDAKTPIDEVAAHVKEGAALILALNTQLNAVEAEVANAFKMLEEASVKPA